MSDSAVYRYRDPEAARVMKAAKHDPETTGAVHAARRYGPATIATKQWGKGSLWRMMAEEDIPHGRASTERGRTIFYEDQPPDVNVRKGADAPATLAHELGHVIMAARHSSPRDRAEREAAADLFARQGEGKRALADPVSRQFVRDIVVEGLGKDIRRGGEVDLSHRPSALQRLNRELEHERKQDERKLDRRYRKRVTYHFPARRSRR